MDGGSDFRVTPRLIAGLGILAFGVLWTLDNFGLFDAERVLEFWPVILIAIGLARLLDPYAGNAGAVVLIVVGSFLLLHTLDLFDWDFWDLIPVFIILLGGKLVWESMRGRHPSGPRDADPNSQMSVFAMMAGVKRQSTARDFRGGDATAIMGGIEIDLREAGIKNGEAILDTFSLMGGVELTVPENWVIVGRVLPLMGSFEDKTRPPKEPGPRLIIKGLAVMGGVEVKN